MLGDDCWLLVGVKAHLSALEVVDEQSVDEQS